MKVLVTGATGRLGYRVAEAARRLGWQVSEWQGRLLELDRLRQEARGQVVIHTAACSSVARCFADPEAARRVNAEVPAVLAEVAERLVHVSTDMVFDGSEAPYVESDPTNPLSTYGRTKLEGERAVLAAGRHLAARACLLYGPSPWRPDFHEAQLAALRERRPLQLFRDEWRTPIAYADAAEALVRLAAHEATGIVHLGGPERLTRYEMGLRLAASLDLDPSPLVPVYQAEVASSEPRARDLSLDCRRLAELLPGFEPSVMGARLSDLA